MKQQHVELTTVGSSSREYNFCIDYFIYCIYFTLVYINPDAIYVGGEI